MAENEDLRDEPTVTVRQGEYSFMPPVKIEVEYEGAASTTGQALHLTWTAAQDLYQKLGEHLRQHTGEEI